MSDLRSRVDAWLDADLTPAAPRDETFAVAAAVARGRRLRARRRTAVAGAFAAVAAGVATVIAVGGLPALTTQPEPPSGPSPTRGPLDAWRDARPLAVEYPGGTVTWPAPASGWAWTVPGRDSLPAGEAGQAFMVSARKFFGMDRTEVPDDGRGSSERGILVRALEGGPTQYVATFVVTDGPRRAAVEVMATRGAASDQVWDRCGRWPVGAPGLGIAQPEDVGGCSLSTTIRDDEPLTVVRDSRPALPARSEGRSVFTVLPDGTAVRVVVSRATAPDAEPPPLRALPGWDVLEVLAAGTAWPVAAGSEAMPLDVVYPDAGSTTTVAWPAPASGLPWFVADPSVPVGGVAMEATDGARDLATALADALGDQAVREPAGAGERPPYAAVVGAVDGRPTAYLAEVGVRVRAALGARWTYRAWMTRGGVTVRPVPFDLCGTWPQGVPGLAMTDGEKSVWFEEFGTPRECSVVVTPQAFVIHLVARPPERSGDVPGRLLLHAFTVRSDGTAVAAQVSARPGDREDLLFEQLDRLVLDLPHPGRP